MIELAFKTVLQYPFVSGFVCACVLVGVVFKFFWDYGVKRVRGVELRAAEKVEKAHAERDAAVAAKDAVIAELQEDRLDRAERYAADLRTLAIQNDPSDTRNFPRSS